MNINIVVVNKTPKITIIGKGISYLPGSTQVKVISTNGRESKVVILPKQNVTRVITVASGVVINNPTIINNGGSSGSSPANSFQINILDAINKGQVVDNDGRIVDSNDINQKLKIIGIAAISAPANSSINAQTNGILPLEQHSLLDGYIFLNGKLLSNTPPERGFLLNVGTLLAGKLNISIKEPIEL